MKACRPCSRCRDDEYEIRPCTPTSNVVCRKCRQCPPGSEVEKSCEGKKDTVCKKCNTLDSGRKCKNRGLQRTPGTKFSRHVSLVSAVEAELAKSRLHSKQILKMPSALKCEIKGAQYMICRRKIRVSSQPGAKVRRQQPLGPGRAQP